MRLESCVDHSFIEIVPGAGMFSSYIEFQLQQLFSQLQPDPNADTEENVLPPVSKPNPSMHCIAHTV